MSYGGFNTNNFKEDLTKAGVAKTDHPKIISSLEKLLNAGIPKSKLNPIINKIMTDRNFRTDFLKDFKQASSLFVAIPTQLKEEK